MTAHRPTLNNMKSMIHSSQPVLESLYTVKHDQFTNGYMQTLSKRLDYIEVNLKYVMEEFSFFSALRINHKPNKVTHLRVTFFKSCDDKYIEVYVGKLNNNKEME